jgi:Pyruvate/2-oxoacid:ferredoxin oxidoreductase gamma subunit
LNGPSLERFGEDVVSGGAIFYNSSMVRAAPSRSDVTPVGVPANLIAERLGNPKAANMVILGAMLARGCAVSKEAVLAALPGALKSPELVELNRRAIDAGMEFGAGLAAPHE